MPVRPHDPFRHVMNVALDDFQLFHVANERHHDFELHLNAFAACSSHAASIMACTCIL